MPCSLNLNDRASALPESCSLLTLQACAQVFREVAVFDRINRAGSYATRVQRLGSFAAPSR